MRDTIQIALPLCPAVSTTHHPHGQCSLPINVFFGVVEGVFQECSQWPLPRSKHSISYERHRSRWYGALALPVDAMGMLWRKGPGVPKPNTPHAAAPLISSHVHVLPAVHFPCLRAMQMHASLLLPLALAVLCTTSSTLYVWTINILRRTIYIYSTTLNFLFLMFLYFTYGYVPTYQIP